MKTTELVEVGLKEGIQPGFYKITLQSSDSTGHPQQSTQPNEIWRLRLNNIEHQNVYLTGTTIDLADQEKSRIDVVADKFKVSVPIRSVQGEHAKPVDSSTNSIDAICASLQYLGPITTPTSTPTGTPTVSPTPSPSPLPTPTITPIAYAPYCGDGQINQPWEQCDGGQSCDETCQIPTNECTTNGFARVFITTSQHYGNSTRPVESYYSNDVFLGSRKNRIPQGAWFPIVYNGEKFSDPDPRGSSTYEDVPGLAVQRQNGQIYMMLHGSHEWTSSSSPLEHLQGYVELKNVKVSSQLSDNSGNNSVSRPNDGIKTVDHDQDELWINPYETNKSYFWLSVGEDDDAFWTKYNGAPSCPAQNRPPTIDAPDQITITAGQSLKSEILAQDPDGDEIKISIQQITGPIPYADFCRL